MTDPFDAARVAYEQGHKDGYDSARQDGWVDQGCATATALDAARSIVAGFLDIDPDTGDRRCSDPACDLCVVAPLIYAALEDLSAGGQP